MLKMREYGIFQHTVVSIKEPNTRWKTYLDFLSPLDAKEFIEEVGPNCPDGTLFEIIPKYIHGKVTETYEVRDGELKRVK
jgi:hypothetical protein